MPVDLLDKKASTRNNQIKLFLESNTKKQNCYEFFNKMKLSLCEPPVKSLLVKKDIKIRRSVLFKGPFQRRRIVRDNVLLTNLKIQERIAKVIKKFVENWILFCKLGNSNTLASVLKEEGYIWPNSMLSRLVLSFDQEKINRHICKEYLTNIFEYEIIPHLNTDKGQPEFDLSKLRILLRREGNYF